MVINIKITNKLINISTNTEMLLTMALEKKGHYVTNIDWNHTNGTIILDNKLYDVTSYLDIDKLYDVTLFEETLYNLLFPKSLILKFIQIN